MQHKDFQELLNRYLSGKATEFEKQLLDVYYDRLSVAGNPFKSIEEEEAIKAEILQNIRHRIHDVKVVKISKRPLMLLMAAAVFAGLLITGYFWFTIKSDWKEGGKDSMAQKGKGSTILPGRSGAILQLTNGKSILLDTLQNGAVIVQENVRIIKEDGNIRYESAQTGNISLAKLTNTVSTPIGRKWSLEMPDGSMVWLNSESTITYPLVFEEKERLVQMSGEAYFEVEHKEYAPFRVKVGPLLVEDLGTSFNVNSYADNSKQYVTLVEGLAQVKSSKTGKLHSIDLTPGQQVEASNDGILKLNSKVMVEDVIAWKNGLFKFSEGTITEVMNTAARWYGFTVSYDGLIKDHFVLNVSRDLPLSSLLEIMESTGRVRFEVSGNQVKVFAGQLNE